MQNPEQAMPRVSSGEEALELLMAGNRRFIQNLKINRSLHDQVIETQFEQHPMAAVVSCMDSHVAPELLFDLGLGEIYAIRTAGNAVSEEVVDSLEYTVQAGVKLLVVLGHTNCRAIDMACRDGSKTVRRLAQLLKPAIKQQRTLRPVLEGLAFTNAVACVHVQHSLDALVKQSTLIKKKLLSRDLMLVGGMYDVTTGMVEFFTYDILQLQSAAETEKHWTITSDVLVK